MCRAAKHDALDTMLTKLDASGRLQLTAAFSGKGSEQALTVAGGRTALPNDAAERAPNRASEGFLVKLS